MAGEEEDREEFVRLDNCGNPVKLTTAEKERVFLDALQSYYSSGRQALTDGDFDLLKQDLAWEGSDVIFLTRNETLFLNAMSAYMKGQPIMTDEEFDTLKAELRNQGSRIAVTSDPKCAVDTGVCRVTWKKDRIRNYMVYLPWLAVSTVLWSFLAFEFIPVLRSVNPFLNLLIGSPIIWTLAKAGTENLFLRDPLIAYGPCPNCGYQNRILFGDVLGVEGFGASADIVCANCGASLRAQRQSLRVESNPKGVAA